jgi:UDP-galactose transporter B1
MVMGWALYGKTFPLFKYLAVGLITFGVSVFMLTDPHKGSKGKGAHGVASDSTEERSLLSSLIGLVLLTANLMIDGVTNSTQDRIFSHHKISGQQMMFFMNVCSATLMAGYLIVSNPFTHELSKAIAFCSEHPSVWYDIGLFALMGALGQVFIFYTLQTFGSLVLVTVTVTRKMLSIIISVVWFGHVLSGGQWLGVGIVFVGVCFEDLVKQFGVPKILGVRTVKKAKAEDGDEKLNGRQTPSPPSSMGKSNGWLGDRANRGQQRILSRNSTNSAQLENGIKSE